MLTRYPLFATGMSALVLTLAACGGGGGFVSSTPPPPTPTPTPNPTPTPTLANVTIFANPAAGDYATVGASISGPGGNLDTYSSADERFGTVSSADQDQPHIRYASGYYEIEMPGTAWDPLVPYQGMVNPPADNNYFQPQSVAMNYAYLATTNARENGYSYSELGSWSSDAASRWGWVAFGEPTPSVGVPVTGSASYAGSVAGSADIMSADYLYGGYDTTPIAGTVALNFDFGKGTFDGAMSLSLSDYVTSVDLGTFDFKDTVFSAGSTSYSGKFDTNATGDNFFVGRFTGPSAEETIGAWALPFEFSNGTVILPADDQTHQAMGAWIAKRP